MNTIKWNEVTWYSKLGAVILFIVVVPILTFYIGRSYQQLQEIRSMIVDVPATTTPTTATSTSVTNTPGSLLYQSDELGFKVKYPEAWGTKGALPEDAIAGFVAVIPSGYQGPEHLSEQYLATHVPDSITITKLEAGVAVFTGPCRDADLQIARQDNQVVNGITFDHIVSNDAAMSYAYYSELYSTYRNNACYQIYLNEVTSSPGAYVGSQELVRKINGLNDRVTVNAQNQFKDFVNSFQFIDSPVGMNEADVTTIPLTRIDPPLISIGGAVTITGSQFSGHDTLVWIEKGTDRGVLWGGMPQSDVSIDMVIPTKVCTRYTGASGLPCPWYMTLKPGVYQIRVENQNGRSNPLPLTIR